MDNTYRVSWSIVNPETGKVEARLGTIFDADTSLGAYLFAEYRAKQMLYKHFPQYVELAEEYAMEIVTEAEEQGQALDEESILSEKLLEYIDIEVKEIVH